MLWSSLYLHIVAFESLYYILKLQLYKKNIAKCQFDKPLFCLSIGLMKNIQM